MPLSGFFITLFDEDTLSLYLDRGIYGFHMRPELVIGPRSRHYQALADYACAREGTHVFFFLKRRIVYGGQIIGSPTHGAFYLNGTYSPLGSKAQAPLVWDESHRQRYKSTDRPGIFTRPAINDTPVCQPYLIRFEDKLGLKGNSILSDDLYFELGDFPYPLPTNSIADMSFCTMTPAEVRIALRLLQEHPLRKFETSSVEPVELTKIPVAFHPEYGLSRLKEAENEAQLEFSLLANPRLLPAEIQPKDETLCRQVPMSAFKPSQMDRAGVCYYSADEIRNGSIPNTLIELKTGRAGKREIEQVARYVRWLDKRIGPDSAKVRFVLFANSQNIRDWNMIPDYGKRIKPISFGVERLLTVP